MTTPRHKSLKRAAGMPAAAWQPASYLMAGANGVVRPACLRGNPGATTVQGEEFRPAVEARLGDSRIQI